MIAASSIDIPQSAPRWREMPNTHGLMRTADDCSLEEIPQWMAIMGACRNCLRTGQVYRKYLVRRFGEKAILVDLESKLRCTRCRGRGRNAFVLKQIPRG